jgi:hypothetical protein
VLRKTFPAALLWLLRRCARRLVFDFDDAIFCNSDGTPSARAWRASPRWRAPATICWPATPSSPGGRRLQPGGDRGADLHGRGRYAGDRRQAGRQLDLVWIGSRSTRKYLVGSCPGCGAAAKRAGLRLKIIADFDLPGCGVATLAVAWHADRSARAGRRAHRHRADARRRLEPRQVRAEGAAMHGGRPAGGVFDGPVPMPR